MKVLASAAISMDGYLDDISPQRLILSNKEDWEEVRRLRAESDAILIGAETLRKDNPSLITTDDILKEMRKRKGLPEDPVKVTVTHSGNLDINLNFFQKGNGVKIVITNNERWAMGNYPLVKVICPGGSEITAKGILKALEGEGINKLLLEGGSAMFSMFLKEDAIDEFRLAVAPFFVGESSAPRLVSDGIYPFKKNNIMKLMSVKKLGDMAILNYERNHAMDLEFLEKAIALSHRCPKSDVAYSVGAVIVAKRGNIYEGYSRETSLNNHAEEEAINKALEQKEDLRSATLYSSMEPCSTRGSRLKSCTALIIENHFAKVVFAASEPPVFEECEGEELLKQAGIETLKIDSLAEKALEANRHII